MIVTKTPSIKCNRIYFHLNLHRIHTIPSVPIVDCFQKIRQQVKCYLQMAGSMGKHELNEVRDFMFRAQLF